MIESNKTYGFTIAVKELRETVPNIFRYASAYKRLNNITSQGLWEMFVEPQEDVPEDEDGNPLPEDIQQNEPGGTPPDVDPEAMEGEKYNMCHFWSNFEIARLSWFRSKEYNDFFEMMDRSGGFWMERVGFHSFGLWRIVANSLTSGEMLPSTRWPLARFWHQEIFITSVTLDTDTPPFNTARPTLPRGNSHVNPSWRRQRSMSENARRRTSTGRTGTKRRRTEWDAAAAVTPISSMSKARKAPVSQNGSMSQAAGPAHKREENMNETHKAKSFFHQRPESGYEYVFDGRHDEKSNSSEN